MDKALQKFEKANEYKYIQITMFDSIQRLVCFEQSHHCLISSNMSPDPTADAPMPLILAPSWHSFRGFYPPDLGAEHHVAANAASCTHGSL